MLQAADKRLTEVCRHVADARRSVLAYRRVRVVGELVDNHSTYGIRGRRPPSIGGGGACNLDVDAVAFRAGDRSFCACTATW